jgi:undecaprenyl-diphosphatase
MINQLLNLDSYFSQVVSAALPHNLFFDKFFSFLSLKGYAFPVWAIVVAILLILEEKWDKKHHFIGYFLLSFIATAIIVSYPLKTVFHRQRPIPNKTYSAIACPTDFSFPSGHAATAFAAATLLSAYDKKRRWFYYLVAVFISLSRIYLQCHYLLDVFGGGLFGTLMSRGILLLRGRTFFNVRLPE